VICQTIPNTGQLTEPLKTTTPYQPPPPGLYNGPLPPTPALYNASPTPPPNGLYNAPIGIWDSESHVCIVKQYQIQNNQQSL
jgi:hypothetical protein